MSSDYCKCQKVTGGVLPQAPLEAICYAQDGCPYKGRNCLFVQLGGIRPVKQTHGWKIIEVNGSE